MDYEKRLGAAGTQLREYIAQRTATAAQDWFFTFRAREAMQVVFEVLAEENGGQGEVLTQLLTCSTVPEAIIAAGLRPRYIDIDKDTFAVRAGKAADAFEAAEQKTPVAAIFQHSYGLFADEAAKTLQKAAGGAGALFIEDCAHCALTLARGEDGLPLADVSVHSFGVEKMIRTTFGAAVWISPDMKDKALRERLTEAFAALPALDPAAAASVKSYRNRFRVLSHLPMRLRRPLRAKWVAKRRFIPAVAADELAGRTVLEPSVPSEEVLSLRRLKLTLNAWKRVWKTRAHRLLTIWRFQMYLYRPLQGMQGRFCGFL